MSYELVSGIAHGHGGGFVGNISGVHQITSVRPIVYP